MFKSTEKYKIYTSEDKLNNFITVINKQNNRLMSAYTYNITDGIIIKILSEGPSYRYEKYIGKYKKHQLVFDESIGEFIVNAEDSGVKFRITLDHEYKSYSDILDWFHKVDSTKNDNSVIASDVISSNYTERFIFNPTTFAKEGSIIIKYEDDVFTIEFAGSEVHVVMPKDIARHYLPLPECNIVTNFVSNTLSSIEIHPLIPITRISDVDLKDSSTVSANYNIEGKTEISGVKINFMKS